MLVRSCRILAAWLLGSVVAYVLASIAHTQTVLAELGALGVSVGTEDRLATTFGDLAGLWRYGVVIGLAIGLGLVATRVATRRAWREAYGLPLSLLSGVLAVAGALIAMKLAFAFTPIASARGGSGFALQCLAGAAGGLVYSIARPTPRTDGEAG